MDINYATTQNVIIVTGWKIVLPKGLLKIYVQTKYVQIKIIIGCGYRT